MNFKILLFNAIIVPKARFVNSSRFGPNKNWVGSWCKITIDAVSNYKGISAKSEPESVEFEIRI